MAGTPTDELIDECRRQEEGCNYTGVSFLIWLRWMKTFRLICYVAPVIFGALATWKIVSQGSPTMAAVCTLLATVIPPAYKATRADKAIEDYITASGEFINLRDRFRQVANIYSHEPFTQFEAKCKPLLDRLEKVRARSLTPPNWFFWLSQRKIQSGDYKHDHDIAKENA